MSPERSMEEQLIRRLDKKRSGQPEEGEIKISDEARNRPVRIGREEDSRMLDTTEHKAPHEGFPFSHRPESSEVQYGGKSGQGGRVAKRRRNAK